MKGTDLNKIIEHSEIPVKEILLKGKIVRGTYYNYVNSDKEVKISFLKKIKESGVDVDGLARQLGIENIHFSENSNIKINDVKTSINTETSSNIAVSELTKKLADAEDTILILKSFIKRLQGDSDTDDYGGEVHTNTKGGSKRPKPTAKKTSQKN